MRMFIVQVPVESEESLGDPSALQQLLRETEEDEEEDRRLELGEAWAGLHFLLTAELPIPKHEALARGVSWDEGSLENVLMGGAVIPSSKRWGPARYLSPVEVRSLAAQLSATSVEAFLEGFELDALEEEGIPLGDEHEEEKIREWLSGCFSKLVEFYARASAQGHGLLLCMA